MRLWIVGGAVAGGLVPLVLLNVVGLLVYPRSTQAQGAQSMLCFASLCLAQPGAVIGGLLGAYLAYRTRRDRDGG